LTEEQFEEMKTLLEKINSNLELMDSRLYALEECITSVEAGRSAIVTREASE
jgi:hypothetical protein